MAVSPPGDELSRMGQLLRPSLAIALALAAAACGRGPESDHVQRIQALCSELARSGAGPSEAEQVLGGPPQLELCATDLPPASTADRCPHDGTPVCIRVWAYRARSESLCGGEGCSYGCELRAPQDAPQETCSVRFLSGLERPALEDGGQ
jgi:hypothetical protein